MAVLYKIGAIAMLLLLGACGPPAARTESGATAPSRPSTLSEPCRTLRHQQGETEICGQPQRIVVLGPYLLEPVLALGAQPAGYGDHIALHQGDYDNPAQQIPYLGDRVTTQPINVGLAYQPSIEAILRVQPDLILSPDYNAAQYDALSQIAPTLVLDVVDGPTNLSTIGIALNQTSRAEALLASLRDRITQAKVEFSLLIQQQPTLLILASEDAQTFNLMSHQNGFCGSLLHELGFQLIYPDGIKESDLSGPTPLSIETLPQLNEADSILLFGFSWEAVDLQSQNAFATQQLRRLKQSWEENAIAQSLDASKAGRVYFIPAYLCLGLPGPIGAELYLNELETQLLSSPPLTP